MKWACWATGDIGKAFTVLQGRGIRVTLAPPCFAKRESQMARALGVYLQRDLVGHRIQDVGGQMIIGYGKGWLKETGACALSQLPPVRRGASRGLRSYRDTLLNRETCIEDAQAVSA